MPLGLSPNVIGISLAIVASISGAMGNLFFRLSWKSEKYRKLIRFGGLCTVVAADPARILSFGYGDPQIVAPFSALSLVWLILLSNPIAGDKPNGLDVSAALVIASGVVLIALFGSGEGGSDEDDGYFGIDDKASTRHQLFKVIETFDSNAEKGSFVAYMVGQALFLLGAGVIVSTQNPNWLGPKIAWGALGGVLQVSTDAPCNPPSCLVFSHFLSFLFPRALFIFMDLNIRGTFIFSRLLQLWLLLTFLRPVQSGLFGCTL